jgi:hypothetical protein
MYIHVYMYVYLYIYACKYTYILKCMYIFSQGKDVDEAILRERERDLRKINQDLAMVNEMFK